MKGIFVSVELLEDLRDAANESMNATTRQHQIDHFAGLIAKADALLSAPSPAVVDGLDVVGTIATMGFGRHCISADFTACDKLKVGDSVTAMLPTQAIIAGLRGEVERSQRFAAGHVLTNERISANLHAVESERDQQAQRIGELAELAAQANVNCKNTAYYLRKYRPDLADICSGWCVAIDAALSAGKEGSDG